MDGVERARIYVVIIHIIMRKYGPADGGAESSVGADTEQHSREHIELYRGITRSELVPLTHTGAEGRVNRPLVLALATTGLLGRLFDREAGISAHELCLLREGISLESSEAEAALALQGLGGFPIILRGTELLKKTWVDRIATGKVIAGFALTESDSGSDAAALKTTAEVDGDGFRLTGRKVFISNAPDADVYTIFARVEGMAGGITAFVLPGDAEGLSGGRIDLLSSHPIGWIEMDRVFLPRDHVLGEVGAGFRVAMETLNLFRPSVGAFAVGAASAALEAAVRYSVERQAFGSPIKDFQSISHRLAEMATQLQAARLLVYRAAREYDSGGSNVAMLAAMAKLFATETAQQVIDVAIQVHGASGLVRGSRLEGLYRDIRGTRIYEGTSEIQKEIISRQLYKQASDQGERE